MANLDEFGLPIDDCSCECEGNTYNFNNCNLTIPESFGDALSYEQQILVLEKNKQDKLIPGDNITITETDEGPVISASGEFESNSYTLSKNTNNLPENIVAEYNLVEKHPDGTYENVGETISIPVIAGPQGPQGETGATGPQGPAGPSNVTPIITEGTAIADINGTTIFAPNAGGMEFNGNHVYTILSTTNKTSFGYMTNQFKGTINADSLEPGDIIFVYYYGTDETDATLEVTLNNSVITAPIMYRDITNNTVNTSKRMVPELRNVNIQIDNPNLNIGGMGVLKLQYWPAETYAYSLYTSAILDGNVLYNPVDMFLLMDLDGMYILKPEVGDVVNFSINNIFQSVSGTLEVTYAESEIKAGTKNQIPYVTGYIGIRLNGSFTTSSSGYFGIAFRRSEGRGQNNIEKLCLIQYNNVYYPGYLHISDRACYISSSAFPANLSIASGQYIGIIS